MTMTVQRLSNGKGACAIEVLQWLLKVSVNPGLQSTEAIVLLFSTRVVIPDYIKPVALLFVFDLM